MIKAKFNAFVWRKDQLVKREVNGYLVGVLPKNFNHAVVVGIRKTIRIGVKYDAVDFTTGYSLGEGMTKQEAINNAEKKLFDICEGDFNFRKAGLPVINTRP